MTSDNHIDNDTALQFHDCHGDKATLVHGRDGSVIEYYRDPPKRMGASVRDMDKFMSCETRGEDALDPISALILGIIIGASCVASAGMLWWVFA